MQTSTMNKFKIRRILLSKTNNLTSKKIKRNHLRTTHFLAETENGAIK